MVCMYCLGDLRSATFSPRARRSRSRWRSFSRSSATDFMRLDKPSVASSGIASVSTVAIAQHLRQVAERFRQVAAGFLLDRDHDAEEVRLRQRNAIIEFGAGFADRDADGLSFDDRAHLAFKGLGCVDGDDAQAVE